jgi:hypothetical protein
MANRLASWTQAEVARALRGVRSAGLVPGRVRFTADGFEFVDLRLDGEAAVPSDSDDDIVARLE